MRHSCTTTLLVYVLMLANFSRASTIYGWGKNDNGQLGLGNYNDPILNITVIPFYSSVSVTTISVGENTHFATNGSSYYSCGSNSEGQLGQGVTTATYSTPTLMPGLTGNFTIYALPKATVVYSPLQKTISGCGFAAGYVRGLSTGDYYKLQPVLPNFGFAGVIEDVYTANGACFVRLTNGSIYTAGISAYGVFGIGTSASSPAYQKMTYWDILQVSPKIFTTQASSVCAQANYSLYCWGSNSVGQLGLNNSNDNFFTPTRVEFFDDQEYYISQVKQGTMHTIALTCGGRVFTWGSNQRGQLGIGTSDTDAHTAPIEVEFLRDKSIVEIVAGAYHNFARTASDDWFFWGMGDTGVSSLGVTADILAPTSVPQFKQLGINHIKSSAYSQFALGWNSSVFSVPPSCPSNWDIDECNPVSPCGANMDCLNTERLYICACKPGFELDDNDACQDIDECAGTSSPCVSLAKCNNTIGSFECNCELGFVGDGLPQPQGNGCVPAVCGNGIVESGEQCDTLVSPSCCNSTCHLQPAGYLCHNATIVCDPAEYCDGIGQFCPTSGWIPGSFCDYCGNGQCNNVSETCSNCAQDCGSCDACTGILCNGKCVSTPLDCVVICNSTDFACASGICVNDFTTCETHNCSSSTTECWDGSCASDLSLCPVIPACPVLTKRCNGKCISATDACSVSVAVNCSEEQQATDQQQQVVCLDGMCAAECPQYNGCSTGLIRCPSGECALDLTVCQGHCTSGLYECADGSCNGPYNCSVLLQFEAAIPFTQHIPPTKNSTIGVVSTSGIPIVSLDLIQGTFRNTTSVGVSAVSQSGLTQIRSPSTWNGTGIEQNLFSSAVAFDVDASTRFVKPITISFNGSMPAGMNISDLCMGFVNSSGQWDCASAIQYINGTFIGNTTHFTPFGVIRSVHPPVLNSLSKDDLAVFKNISVNSVIVYVYCGLLIVFAVMFAWAFHADREEKRKTDLSEILHTEEYEYEEEPRPPVTRKSITLFRAETPPSASIDASSPVQLSTLSSPAVPPVSQPSDGELSIVPLDNAQPSSTRPRRKTIVMKEAAQTRFTTKHKWLSIYFTARIENLPRVARVVILLTMIMTNMTVAAVFYNSQNRSSTGERIIVGIISSLISFVCSFAIFMMFKLVHKKYRPICYAVSVIWILGTGFLTLWYNLKLEQSTAYGWCISSAIGIVQDAILNEPAKIVVISILIAFCPFIPFVNKL